MSNEDAKSVNTRDLRRAPRSLNGVRRDAEVRVRMTRSERALLEAKAKNLGWSMARTLLHATLHPASAQEIDTDNLAEVYLESLLVVHRIGTSTKDNTDDRGVVFGKLVVGQNLAEGV